MRHVGVLSLSVGDTVILEQEETEEEETDLGSALIQAITADCTEAVEFLLLLGADPNCTSASGTTPLILACRNNSINIAKLLLKAEENVNALDKLDTQGILGANSLMYACWHKHADTVRILLDNGADPNMQDQDNNTALHITCYTQMTVGVELLLAYGADHSLQSKDTTTPLMYACFKEVNFTMDPSILILLLSAGADPNDQNDEDSTALIAAAYFGYKEGVSVLLNAGANVNIQNKFGMTALHEAAENGFLAISELLLASGA